MQIHLTLDAPAARAVLATWKAQVAELNGRINDLEAKLNSSTSQTPPVFPSVHSAPSSDSVVPAPRGKNFQLVYDYLKQHGQSGVTQIAKATGLVKTSVSSVVRARRDVFLGENGKWSLVEGITVPESSTGDE